MRVYVKSRGHYQQQGYQWKKEEPFNDFFKEITAWVDNDYFSVVIGRCDGKLLLYVTGLESNRKDYRTRPIMNSVVWESENDDDDKKICRIAALALEGNLANKIEAAIKEEKNVDTDFGFEVQLEKLISEEWLKVINEDGKDNVKVSLENSKRYIASDTQEHRQQLADELRQYILPKMEGAIVVVTIGLTEEKLRKKCVWRGISELIKTEQGGWREIKEGGLGKILFRNNEVNHKLRALPTIIAIVSISLAAIYQLSYNSMLPTLLTSFREPFSSTVTSPKRTIELKYLSPISVKESILFTGNYNPQETPTIYLIVDEKYTIFNSKKSPKALKPQEGTWQFSYKGFRQPGMHQISLKGKDKNGKVIELNRITVTVKEKNR